MKSILLVLLSLLISIAPIFGHSHFAVGVVDTNGNEVGDQGEALALVDKPAPGFVFQMVADPLYTGYFVLTPPMEDYFTFTVRSSGDALPAQALHPAEGSYIYMEITSVTGPAGGNFGFWEEEDGQLRIDSFSTPSASFETGQSTGGFKLVLSEPLNPGAPGEDPYGHIHNRVWSVDAPGDYFVEFTVYDLSTNGTDGGPLHTPSETYTFHFQAVPEPGALTMGGLGLGAAALLTRRRRRQA